MTYKVITLHEDYSPEFVIAHMKEWKRDHKLDIKFLLGEAHKNQEDIVGLLQGSHAYETIAKPMAQTIIMLQMGY